MKPRVLFVDDEPNVLEALKRMLHFMRGEWEMAFAGGGKEALELMARVPFDVIVADMRMPEMDGAELLNRVRELYLHVVRIVFSGYSDPAMILRSVKAAHQYLAKPCKAEVLVETVSRALSLMRLLWEPGVRKIVSGITSLPTVPALYDQIMEELHSPDPSPQRIGEIVGRDVAMSAKMLQLVNSAFFGLFRKVSNPADAVRYLGIETVKALVLSLHLFSELRDKGTGPFPAENLWTHSLTVARLAKKIAWNETHDPSLGDAAFTGGLLHDSGRLLLAVCLPETYFPLLQKAAEEEAPLWAIERRDLGASHQEVGGYLLGIWGLPQDIVEAVAFHHRPSTLSPKGKGMSALSAVHIAEALVFDDGEGRGEEGLLDVGHLEEIGKAQFVNEWRDLKDELLEEG